MNRDTFGFVMALFIFGAAFVLLAYAVGNMGEMDTAGDFFSFDGETGRICFLGNSGYIDRKALRRGNEIADAVSEYYLSFTPLRGFEGHKIYR